LFCQKIVNYFVNKFTLFIFQVSKRRKRFDINISGVLKLKRILNLIIIMATNPPAGDNHRNGSVRNRSQFMAPSGNWTKRDGDTGRFMDQKTSGGRFKGVRREK